MTTNVVPFPDRRVVLAGIAAAPVVSLTALMQMHRLAMHLHQIRSTPPAELDFAPNWSFTAKFDGEFASSSQTYAGTGTIRYTW